MPVYQAHRIKDSCFLFPAWFCLPASGTFSAAFYKAKEGKRVGRSLREQSKSGHAEPFPPVWTARSRPGRRDILPLRLRKAGRLEKRRSIVAASARPAAGRSFRRGAGLSGRLLGKGEAGPFVPAGTAAFLPPHKRRQPGRQLRPARIRPAFRI